MTKNKGEKERNHPELKQDITEKITDGAIDQLWGTMKNRFFTGENTHKVGGDMYAFSLLDRYNITAQDILDIAGGETIEQLIKKYNIKNVDIFIGGGYGNEEKIDKGRTGWQDREYVTLNIKQGHCYNGRVYNSEGRGGQLDIRINPQAKIIRIKFIDMGKEKNKKTGTKIIAKQIQTAIRLKFNAVQLFAGGNSHNIYTKDVGRGSYYFWGRIGAEILDTYNREIFKKSIARSNDPDIQECKDIHDIIALGKKGWKFRDDNGLIGKMGFSLEEFSPSCQGLQTYLNNHNISINIYKYKKIDECTISNELKKYLQNIKITDNKKIKTIGDLMQLDSETIKNQKGWTEKMNNELKTYMADLGLKFGVNNKEEN